MANKRGFPAMQKTGAHLKGGRTKRRRRRFSVSRSIIHSNTYDTTRLPPKNKNKYITISLRVST